MQSDTTVTVDVFLSRHNPCWGRTWQALGAAPDEGVLQQMVQQYAEPQRHYHTLQHLDACLAAFAGVWSLAEHPGEVALALWFHDAVYTIGAPDNEQKSADWARDVALGAGLPDEVAQRIHALVMVTRHTVEPQSEDEKLLLDVDLAILGAPQPQFMRYEAQIREEFAAVPEAQFRQRRRTILQQFLQRPCIYRTESFRARLEHNARRNLQMSITRLDETPQQQPPTLS